jgi:hypothetical protein
VSETAKSKPPAEFARMTLLATIHGTTVKSMAGGYGDRNVTKSLAGNQRFRNRFGPDSGKRRNKLVR